MDAKKFSKKYIAMLCHVLNDFPWDEWVQVLDVVEDAFTKSKTLYFIGNGGSASTASHMVNDMMMGVTKQCGRGFRAVSLCDNCAVTMAIANDDGYQSIFSEQVRSLGRADDLLFVISGSGNSPNLVEGVREANKIGMTTVGFLGMDGGVLAGLVDVSIIVPSYDYGIIETVHVALDHLLVEYFRCLKQDDKTSSTERGSVQHSNRIQTIADSLESQLTISGNG